MGSRHLRPVVLSVRYPRIGEPIYQFGQCVKPDSVPALVTIYGGFTLVDIPNLHLLFKRRWNIKPHRRTAYVIYNGRSENTRLHTLLTGLMAPDHINGCGWDNRLSNIRAANTLGQSRNHGPSRGKLHSHYKGISYDPKKDLYRARIMVSGRPIGLGRFKSEMGAADAYDEAARRYHGDFARTNF